MNCSIIMWKTVKGKRPILRSPGTMCDKKNIVLVGGKFVPH